MNAKPSEPDVTSDPARADEAGRDWATEGGAVPAGPATDPEDGDPQGDANGDGD